jgi:hypothetical protein
MGDDGKVLVISHPAELGSEFIQFNPDDAMRRTYGDQRALVEKPPALEGAPDFASALCFQFPEETVVCLFELRAQ